MSKASQLIEAQAFADRLRLALKGIGIRPSPALVVNEFNLRYWGKSITSNTARNWLLGKSIPMQDKLRVLADWLQVSPDELRYGTVSATFNAQDSDADLDLSVLTMQDRSMLTRYMALSLEDRKTVCDVVVALSVAAGTKARQ